VHVPGLLEAERTERDVLEVPGNVTVINREQIDEMVRILRAGIEMTMEDARRDGRFKG